MSTTTYVNSTATIAAWNLATYKNPDSDHDTLTPERIERQAEGLRLLDAELVMLVEIRSEDHLKKLVEHLGNDGIEYEYDFIPQVNPGPSHGLMHIGVIFKEGVEVSNSSLIQGSDLNKQGYRKAYVAECKIGKFDFTVIGVHLKSGREKANQNFRDEQCKVIGEFITDLRGPDDRNPDVLLMGDFNMIPGRDASNFHYLGGDDVMDFISSWDLQERFSHILESGRENLLDGFAISRKRSTEYIRGSLRLFPMHWAMKIGQAKFRNDVSDHLPFAASFQIHSDQGRD